MALRFVPPEIATDAELAAGLAGKASLQTPLVPQRVTVMGATGLTDSENLTFDGSTLIAPRIKGTSDGTSTPAIIASANTPVIVAQSTAAGSRRIYMYVDENNGLIKFNSSFGSGGSYPIAFFFGLTEVARFSSGTLSTGGLEIAYTGDSTGKDQPASFRTPGGMSVGKTLWADKVNADTAMNAPTKELWTNTTEVATTAFVQAAIQPMALGDGISSGFLHGGTTPIYRKDWQGIQRMYSTTRENLVKYSQDFNNSAWLKTASGSGVAPVVTPDYAMAPDGTMTADRVVFDRGAGTGATDYSLLRQAVSTATAGQRSFWVKSNTGTTQRISQWNASSYTEVDVPPTWTRINRDEGSTTFIGIGKRGNTSIEAVADILIWGADLKAGSVLTSHIPTAASTVTVTDYATAGGVATMAAPPTAGTLIYGVAPLNGAAMVNGKLAPQGGIAFKRTTFSNVSITAVSGDMILAQTGTLTAPRVVTLPTAAAMGTGYLLTIVDESGSVTGTNTLTITRAGADTVNGATTYVMNTACAAVTLLSDGVSKWTILSKA